MKKVLLSILIIVTGLLSGCSVFGNDLEKAVKSVDRSQNFTIDLEIKNSESVVVQTGETLIDEDQMIIIVNEQRQNYYFEEDKLFYVYKEDDIIVSRMAFPNEFNELDKINDNNFYDEFDLSTFIESSDGVFTTEEVYFGLTDVQIEVDKYINTIKGTVETSDEIFEIVFTFSDYNDTSFEFPPYTQKSDNEMMCDYVLDAGYTCSGGSDEELKDYSFTNVLLTVGFTESSGEFLITNEFRAVSFTYVPETNIVRIEDENLTISEYVEKYSTADFFIGEYVFDLLDDLYTLE